MGLEHTPGPWEVREGTWTTIVAGKRELADVFLGSSVTPEEGLANAHVMKAAPLLLEACEAVLAMAHTSTRYTLGPELAKVRAALAAARGGAA